jgi:hypothetical protein
MTPRHVTPNDLDGPVPIDPYRDVADRADVKALIQGLIQRSSTLVLCAWADRALARERVPGAYLAIEDAPPGRCLTCGDTKDLRFGHCHGCIHREGLS